MQKALPWDEWKKYDEYPIIDVRSPGEYNKGHISGAKSLPLFSDDERAIIGTLYKENGKEAAMHQALELVGPRLHTIVKSAEQFAPQKSIRIHCWRGGMRSGSVAWLLQTMGFENVYTLIGGYKTYRKYILSIFETNHSILIVGGKTGSAKTDVLQALNQMQESSIDLENLAHHKGSAFGWIGEPEQPTQEQFENNLGESLSKLADQMIWLEDESENIGKVRIPHPFFEQMRSAPVFFLDIPRAVRIPHLVHTYSQYGNDKLESSILKIQKRLGGLNTQNALKALAQNDYELVADIALTYYDKSYEAGVTHRDQNKTIRITSNTVDPQENALLILKHKKIYLNGRV